MLLKRKLRICYITEYVGINRQSLYRWEGGVKPGGANQKKILTLAHNHLDHVELARCGVVTDAMRCQRKKALDELMREDADCL